jgi:hypothetical protein
VCELSEGIVICRWKRMKWFLVAETSEIYVIFLEFVICYEFDFIRAAEYL